MAERSRFGTWLRRLIPALLGAGLLYLTWRLVSNNDAPVEVDFLFVRVELVLWEALLGSFLVGALGVGVVTLYQMARGGLVSRRYRKRLANLETEVHQLRNLPLSPETVDPAPGPLAGSGGGPPTEP